jgi:hypothetical protein
VADGFYGRNVGDGDGIGKGRRGEESGVDLDFVELDVRTDGNSIVFWILVLVKLHWVLLLVHLQDRHLGTRDMQEVRCLVGHMSSGKLIKLGEWR